MIQRRCESCGRQWVTWGTHDPCPDCGHEQRMELGMDVIPQQPARCIVQDPWEAQQVPME